MIAPSTPLFWTHCPQRAPQQPLLPYLLPCILHDHTKTLRSLFGDKPRPAMIAPPPAVASLLDPLLYVRSAFRPFLQLFLLPRSSHLLESPSVLGAPPSQQFSSTTLELWNPRSAPHYCYISPVPFLLTTNTF